MVLTARMTGLQSTDLRDLAKVRKRIDQLDRQTATARAQRAAIVRSLRRNGMTLEQIAEHCGVSRQTVHQWGS